MISQITDKTDIKIFVLYLLMRAERAVDLVTLNDLVVQDGFVNQFDFMDCFFELCETKAIEKTAGADGTEYYSITDEGRVAAETLKSNIIPTIRERSSRSALRLLSFRRRGAKVTSSTEDAGDGKCRLICSAKDTGGEFLHISVLLDTRRQAELMKHYCDEHPELIYRGLLGILSGDIDYLADAWADGGEEDNKTGE